MRYFPLVSVYCHFLETFTSLGPLSLHCKGWDQSQRKVISLKLGPSLLQLIISPPFLSNPQSCEGHPNCGLQSTKREQNRKSLPKNQISLTIVFLLLFKWFSNFPEFISWFLVKYLLKPIESGSPAL